MNGETRLLVTNDHIDVQDFRKITDRFRMFYKIYLNLMKQNRKMSTCNSVGLANTRISTDYA